MKTLIVYAHPKTHGHCSTILSEVERILEHNKISYDILDLYKMKYNPVLHEKEHYTAGNHNISKQNKMIQNLIKKSDKLIFIYPNWWNSPPAILKGFFDRVLTPKFAYEFDKGIPKKLLTGKKAAVFVTSGSKWLLYRIFEKGLASYLIKKYVLKFCGIKTKVFEIGSATKLDSKQVKKIQKAAAKGMKYIY